MLISPKALIKTSPILIAFSIGLMLFVGACSNPKDASKENFKKIIGQYIKDDKACTAGYYQFPLVVSESSKDEYKKLIENNSALFIKQGWIKVEKKFKPAMTSFDLAETSMVYELTPEGAKNSRIADVFKGTMGGSTYYKFCYAKGKELIDISAFGEPVEENGEKIVKVPFTYRVTGKKDDWVDKYPDKSKFILEVNPDQVTLRLTNEGWQILGLTKDLQMFSNTNK
jgi:hypothetical protein